jgi:hypothetical protein
MTEEMTMPMITLSGGADSTILSLDVAAHPWRYGVTVSEETELVLLTASHAPRKTKKDLKPIVDFIRGKAVMDVVHLVVDDPLEADSMDRPKLGGQAVLNPGITPSKADEGTWAFTPGWYLWMAGIAINKMDNMDDQEFNPEQFFISHQWDGPIWQAYDEGRFSSGDDSAEFYELLNKAAKMSRAHVKFRAPYMENRMNKVQVLQMGLEIGAPIELTSSCRYGWMERCGVCAQCIARFTALKTLGVKYT